MEKRGACPFNGKSCVQCAVYRGRHSASGPGPRPSSRVAVPERPRTIPDASDFERFGTMLKPGSSRRVGEESDVRLRVIDVETGGVRTCDREEARDWDWGNADLMRLVDGWQVHTFERLAEILAYKAERGCDEVEVKEAPRFMLLSGG